MIESDSDQVSVDSNESLFSVPSDVENREQYIRNRIMHNLLPEPDLRDSNCGLVRMNQNLEKGITHLHLDSDTDSDGSQAYNEYMKEMDTNNDGRVDREEFLAFIEKKFAEDAKGKRPKKQP